MKMIVRRVGFRWLVFACAIALCGIGNAQVPVSIITPPRFQSFLPNGTPNAFGCVQTFASGTSSPIVAYTDYTGSIELPATAPLDGSGSASIWLTSGTLYSIVIKTAGGINCASGTTLSTTDGVNGSLLNLANTWDSIQTFVQPINLLSSDVQIVFGVAGAQTTLDIPPTSSDLLLHGPPLTTSGDTLVAQNTTQAISNKNLTNGTQINGCGVINGPGTYLCIGNNSSISTLQNGLAVLTGAFFSSATVAPTTATSGIVGIVVSGSGITGTAIIQQSGTANCVFDGGTTAGDYVIPSNSVSGNCHDIGSSSYPTLAGTPTQVLGIVTTTGTGTQPVNLFGLGLSLAVPLNVLGQATIASITPGTGAGTGGTAACVGGSEPCYDNGGAITVTTGSSPSVAGSVAAVTFGSTHLSAACTLSPYNSNAAALSGATLAYIPAPSGTGFTILSGSSALTATTQYIWNWVCSFH